MIKEAISKAMNKENLTREEALQVMKEIMSGEAEQSQVAAFLVALHMKAVSYTHLTLPTNSRV